MKLLLLLSFMLLGFVSGAQQQKPLQLNKEVQAHDRFIYPLDLPMSLSGNYGELRSNHFHGGIDFRVGGVVGAPIKATADGFISKITVSPTGYGNALYITHPGGYVSVYGHLQRFADEIQKYVRQQQYEKESFVVTLELDSLKFPVKQGQRIAYAGNTGSSGGPHLHFEIRNKENLPLDVLERNYVPARDNTTPIFNRVEFFGYSEIGGVPVCRMVERPQNSSEAIRVPENFYVAVDGVDKMEGTNAKLAVKKYQVYLDGSEIYELEIGEVPFDEGKYINSLMEYSLKSSRGKSFIKSYVEPGNMLDYKIWAKNNGIMVLGDTLPHKVKIVLTDYKGNSSSKTYTVKLADNQLQEQNALPEGSYMAWYLANVYETDGFKITIPSASLYRSIYFNADTLDKRVNSYSPVWRIHTPQTPLHTPATVYIKYEGADSLAHKALLASVRSGGKLSGAGGSVENGRLVAKLYSFGNYTVAIDTVAPSVTPNFNNGAVLKGDKVSFVIRDRLSGIKNYRVEIDGNWVVAEFDAKNARLTVPLTAAKIKRGIMHTLKIVVTDNKENKTSVTRKFKW